MGNKYNKRSLPKNTGKKLSTKVTAVPAKVFSVWNKKKTYGDVEKLVAYTAVSKPTIIRALRYGIAQPELVLKISKYFSKVPMDRAGFLEKKALRILNEK